MAKLLALASMLVVPVAVDGAAAESSASTSSSASDTCGTMKSVYTGASCCGQDSKSSGFDVVPMPGLGLNPSGTNVCKGKKPVQGFENSDCVVDGVVQAVEQSGTDVTAGYKGSLATDAVPITTTLFAAGLCAVNVHWHLGTEHRSAGEYDETGTGPSARRLAANARLGLRCKKYNAGDAKFTTEYAWKHCVGMKVGETYEVHWPHSKAGACGTPNQYQTPFYDGVFCRDGVLTSTNLDIGVQGQIFTIVNDETYFYPDLMRGAIVEGNFWTDVAYYTGSTTGTSRSNTVCSKYAPITWQVDRKCHLISASSFDKMCADMKAQRDDMTYDLAAHGARELVIDSLAANNHQRLLEQV